MKAVPSYLAGSLPGDSYGQRMRWARQQTPLSLADAARLIGLSDSQLRRVERGGGAMCSDPAVLSRAAKAYGVSANWLYAGGVAGHRFVPRGYVVGVNP